MRSSDLRLVGATVLCDSIMQDCPVGLSGGLIANGNQPAVDLRGYYVLPGIIDLHGDAFERHISPRPTAPFPIAMGLRGVDRDAAANGVTTAWLAQSWSWEGGQRGPAFAEQLIAAMASYRPNALTDLRLQIRYETHALDSADRLLDVVRRFGIDYVVFNNHLAEAVDLWDRRPHEVTAWAKRSGRTGDELMEVVSACLSRSAEVPESLGRLAHGFAQLGVLFGSHDDTDAETRDYFSGIGAHICEFPTSLPAAKAAKLRGEPVLMGAPNVVRGGSQSGNIAATTLIDAGTCDALVSDYHYPALSQSAFALVDLGVMALPQAWAMISTSPARIMRMTDRGEIAPGKRADLVIIDRETRSIEGTIVNGRITYLSGEAAHRFLDADMSIKMAAE